MITRSRLLFVLVFGLAVALTFLSIPLASSQGVTLVSTQVTGDLPVADPESKLWGKASAIFVPLSAQNVTRPMLLETRVKTVVVRALHNRSQIALLVEWADDTQDDSMVRVQDFRDAVAVQFPLMEGQPFFCMGQQGGDVNIWHWKADWQADIAARQDIETLYPNLHVDQYPFADPNAGLAAGPATYLDANYLPALAAGNLFAAARHLSPVEDVIAGGFGSLTAQPAEAQNVQGYGVWVDSRWRVIFSRDLTSREAEDVQFATDKVYSVAFAAWDGANGERNGQKSASQWVSLQFGGPAPESPAQPSLAARDVEASPLAIVPMIVSTLLILGLAGGALAAFERSQRQ
jgi:hypothetical protein